MMLWSLVGLFITGDAYALPEASTPAEQAVHRGPGKGEMIGVNPFDAVPEEILALENR